ncbi:MAG: SusC/RagA family TonB-linked outer membrane protein [Bacteroidetes bacterium]|nr:SusC/RagA family TonB-linked outer membrane protein [Bacteroidota bacterium]
MKKFLLMCFSFGFALSVWAQDRVVTGKVASSEDGSALPGVNVLVKGTTNGTVTDSEGKYSLTVPPSGGSLVFSFIGLSTQEIEIGERSVIDIQLGLDIKQLSEIVVTAQGIEREQKALGYAQTTISSQLLANKPETDVGRALQGRTPGLQILNSSGLAGSASKISIRGNSSITGVNSPLWVVNGVPINTDQNDIQGSFVDGAIAPARFLDIDPNNIESISVLRGLSATTLYGSQGRNGVILVTTKTGSSKGQQNKFEGSITQSYFATQAVVPEFQNKWANGFDGAYGEFYSNWGPLFDGTPQRFNHPYYEWRNLFPDHPEFQTSATTVLPGQTIPGYIPVAAPNNVKDFFQTGSSSTTSLTLGAKTEFGNLNFSYSHLDENGFVKNNTVQRDNFSMGGNAKLTDKLSFTGTFNFARTDFQTPPTAAGDASNTFGGGPSIFANLFFTPRNIDLTNWPWENPVDHTSVYYRNTKGITNPYWLLQNARQTNLTNRFNSNTSFNYKLTNWLNVTYRLGYDTYSEFQTYWNNKSGDAGFSGSLTPGAYRTATGFSTVIDQSVLVNFNKNLSQDLSLNGVVGYNYRRNTYRQEGLESLGQVVFGLLEHRNFTSTNPRDWRGNQLNYQYNSAIQGVYFDANLGYKSMLYVGLSARNDWASVLEKNNRSQFYPSASVAFIPTAAFPNFASSVLDFLKVRVAYGTSANFGGAYNTRSSLTLNAQTRTDGQGNVVTSALPYTLANPNLKPELLTEAEVGIESQMFERRIKLNASYYDRNAKDQIISRTLDYSTGFGSTNINAGTISNKGFEIALTVTPIRSGNWTWDITTNYTKNTSLVKSLPAGSKSILTSGFTNLGNFAIEGQPLNVIQGTSVPKAPDGQLIVTSTGSYDISNDIGVIANPNPKWFGSALTSLTWKSITFGMQWDYVAGGQIFSYTAATMIGRGVSRDLENFDPTLPLILPGVIKQTDGSGNVIGYTPNTVPLTTAGVFFNNTIVGGSASDRGVYDATRIRFREVSLSYSLPKAWVSKLKLRSVNISAVGSNIWWKAVNAPKYSKADFDRTAYGAGNGAGFDFLGGPSARRFGVNIKVNF